MSEEWRAKVYAPSTRREIDAAIRLHVILRDGNHCQVHGCKAVRCMEVHHIVPVPEGTDDEDNLVLLCRKHHDDIEENGTARTLLEIQTWGGASRRHAKLPSKDATDECSASWQSWVYGGARNPAK